MPAVVNIFVLLFFFLIIFAIIGVQLFATVGHGESLNDYANFEDFPIALLTLLRGSTGEDWNAIMHDMSRVRPGCTPIYEMTYNASMCGYCHFATGQDWYDAACDDCIPLNGCGHAVLAKLFWYVFTLVVTFTLLNVCVAVVLEAWEDAETTASAGIKDDALDAYRAAWHRLDPDGHQHIPLADLPKLLQELPSPLGFLQPPATVAEVHGAPGDDDEYFILEDSKGIVLSTTDADGELVPRKVRRTELRSVLNGPNMGPPLRLNDSQVLVKRMRVRYTKSIPLAHAEVSRMVLKAHRTPKGLHVVYFLPTAIACAHRSFARLDINEELISRKDSKTRDGHTGVDVHPAKILAAMVIVRRVRMCLARTRMRMLRDHITRRISISKETKEMAAAAQEELELQEVKVEPGTTEPIKGKTSPIAKKTSNIRRHHNLSASNVLERLQAISADTANTVEDDVDGRDGDDVGEMADATASVVESHGEDKNTSCEDKTQFLALAIATDKSPPPPQESPTTRTVGRALIRIDQPRRRSREKDDSRPVGRCRSTDSEQSTPASARSTEMRIRSAETPQTRSPIPVTDKRRPASHSPRIQRIRKEPTSATPSLSPLALPQAQRRSTGPRVSGPLEPQPRNLGAELIALRAVSRQRTSSASTSTDGYRSPSSTLGDSTESVEAAGGTNGDDSNNREKEHVRHMSTDGRPPLPRRMSSSGEPEVADKSPPVSSTKNGDV